MKRESWMSDDGYASGLDAERRAPTPWRAQLPIAALGLAGVAVVVSALAALGWFLCFHWPQVAGSELPAQYGVFGYAAVGFGSVLVAAPVAVFGTFLLWLVWQVLLAIGELVGWTFNVIAWRSRGRPSPKRR